MSGAGTGVGVGSGVGVGVGVGTGVGVGLGVGVGVGVAVGVGVGVAWAIDGVAVAADVGAHPVMRTATDSRTTAVAVSDLARRPLRAIRGPTTLSMTSAFVGLDRTR